MPKYKIFELRQQKKLSLGQLSILSNVSKSYLSEIESGKKTNLSYEVLQKIAKALNVNVDDLVEKNN